MGDCIGEDDLLDLAHGRRALGDAPGFEAHLADCAACSALLSTLIATPEVTPRPGLVGATLGPYRLDGLIGAGAMGEVYRGWDARLRRHVAVKVLSRPLAGSADRIRRLEAEARAAAAIAHPNVVTVYDTGATDDVPYVVSELITGESLRSVIDRGPIARRTALTLGLGLARGLAAAHAQGVIHRDLKPGNLIVTEDGTLKILDFGLAKLMAAQDVEATEPGTLLGTSGYLSPEQARGEPADTRSDLFSVGAILYELLTGRRAFGGATFAERISAVLRDTPAAVDDPAWPIVLRCLDKDPRKRFQSAGDLAWVLEGLLQGDAPTSRPAVPLGPPSPDVPARPDLMDRMDLPEGTGGTARPARKQRMIRRRTFVAGMAATGIAGVLAGRWLQPARRSFHPAYRQLSFRQGRVACARFTHDGGSIVYSALWEELPQAIYTSRLAGGGTRALELPPAQLLAVSARGELAISLDHHYVEGFHQRGQLAVVPLEGGEPRGLGISVQDAAFTPDGPDGTELAVVRRVDGRFRLELPVGRVLLEAGWLSQPRVSPDGTLVACLVHDGPNDDRGDVVIVPRRGGAARTIAAGWSSIDGLAWAPGGRALWISASRDGGNNSVRAIALDGRELAHLPSAGRLRVHDILHDGRLAVTHVSARMRMMVKAPGGGEEVDLALSDIALVADISVDGRSLVFAEFGDVDTANGAYLRPTDGGPALRLGAGLPVDLADDGRGVLVALYDEASALAVFPVPEGQPRPLAFPGLVRVRSVRWCAGDRMIVAAARDGRPPRLWRVDPDGSVAPITDEGVFGRCAVSPDGHRAALIVRDRLVVADVAGGAPARVVSGSFVDREVCGWSTGDDVFVRSKSAPVRVSRLNVVTGASTQVLEVVPPRLGRRGIDAFVVSQDASAYAYSYGQELSRLYTMTTEDSGASG